MKHIRNNIQFGIVLLLLFSVFLIINVYMIAKCLTPLKTKVHVSTKSPLNNIVLKLFLYGLTSILLPMFHIVYLG